MKNNIRFLITILTSYFSSFQKKYKLINKEKNIYFIEYTQILRYRDYFERKIITTHTQIKTELIFLYK